MNIPQGPYRPAKPKQVRVEVDVCHKSGELMWNPSVRYPADVMAERFNQAWQEGYKAAMNKRAATRAARKGTR